MHYNCLIVDDEKELAESTCEYFNLFDVSTAFVLSYEDCLSFMDKNTVDLILLDINLKNASGFELCKTLRKSWNIPILFISARDSDEDILIALNIGGDDYIKKPYTMRVLLAKVRVALKRIGEGIKEPVDGYESEDISADYNAGKVYVRGKEVSLKAMEYKLLVYMIRNKGRIISKEEFFSNVWTDTITSDGTLNVHIRHLREKIEKNPDEPVHIKTVWGRGYSYED